jgi:hypothetical protein
VLVGIDQPIGRQRLFGDVALRSTRYGDERKLDNTGGSMLIGADWSALDLLSGRLSLGADRVLARYSPDQGPPGFTDRNMQDTQEFIFRGQYGLESLLAIEAGFVHRRLDFSAPQEEFANNEFEQDTVSVGLRFRPTGPLSLGIAYRRTEGRFASTPGGGGPDDFERDDVDLTARWVATGQSTVTARVSRTKETHNLITTRNLSTTTGALGWTFKPTGKLELGLDFIRDSGAESAFGLGGGAPPVADASVLSNTGQVRLQYDVTAKVQLTGSVRQQRRRFAGGLGTDETLESRLGANWSVLRSLVLGCTVGREERDSTVLSYSASFVRCLAQFKTQ